MRRLAKAALASACVLWGCQRSVRPEPPAGAFYEALRLEPVGQVGLEPQALRGQVVLVSFFATWCFPCLADLPVLQRLQAQYGERGFTVVLVGMDLDGARVLAPFAEEYRLPFPVLVANAPIREGRSPFGRISALPTNVLLDRDGRVLLAYAGVARPEALAQAVDRATQP